MKNIKHYNIKNILFTGLWIVLGVGAVVLLVAAVKKKDQQLCKGIDISISGVSNNFFIDKGDVQKIVTSYGGKNAVGKPITYFNLRAMETALRKDIWIKEADLFFDNNEMLQINVEEREPVARIFTTSGNTFYIDSSNMKLPLSEKFSARLPVFTGFPSDLIILSKTDSSLLNDIKRMSVSIQADSFLMAMIDQVDITAQRRFEMIPKIGSQLIVFGDATNAAEKFYKLKLFYKKVMTKTGWNRYSSISLQYKNQVVAKIKGADDVSADSLRTIQMMEIIAANASRMAEDSLRNIVPENDKKNTDISMIQQSMQREEIGDNSNPNEEPKPQERVNLPVEKTIALKPAKKFAVKSVAKPATKPPAAKKTAVVKPPGEKAKAVMPKKMIINNRKFKTKNLKSFLKQCY